MSDIREQYNKLKWGTQMAFIKSIFKYEPGTYVYYYDIQNTGDGHGCVKYGKIGHGFQILKGAESSNSEGQSRHIRLEIEGEKSTWPLCDIYSDREEAILVALESSNYELSNHQAEILISEL